MSVCFTVWQIFLMINNALISNTRDLSKCSTYNPNNKIPNKHLFNIIKLVLFCCCLDFFFKPLHYLLLFGCFTDTEMRFSLISVIFINMFNVKMKITKDKCLLTYLSVSDLWHPVRKLMSSTVICFH